MSQLTELAASIDRACEGASMWVEVGSALQKEVEEPTPHHPVAPFVLAFNYDLLEPGSGRRAEYGPFAPMIEWEGGQAFPPRLEDITADVVDAWEAVLPHVTSPIATARLTDLLWVRRSGEEPYKFALKAIAAYRELARRWIDLMKGECLIRALELAGELNDSTERDVLAEELTVAASEAMVDEEWKPGVPLRLIEALMRLSAASQPTEIDQLLETAEGRYQQDPHIVQAILELKATRARRANESDQDLRRQQVARWRSEADGAEGLGAFADLQAALELARTHGLAEEADEIRRELQEFDRESLGLKRLSAELEIDSGVIESLINGLVQDSWQESLVASPAPGSDRALD